MRAAVMYEQRAPLVVQEVDLLDPDGGRGGPLLGLPDRGYALARGVVEAARVAAGDQQVRHFDAGVDPAGHRAGGPEVDVVGVGHDAQRALYVRQGFGGRREAHPPNPNR